MILLKSQEGGLVSTLNTDGNNNAKCSFEVVVKQQSSNHELSYQAHLYAANVCDIEQPAFVSGQHILVWEIDITTGDDATTNNNNNDDTMIDRICDEITFTVPPPILQDGRLDIFTQTYVIWCYSRRRRRILIVG